VSKYVAAGEALRKKERGDETELPPKVVVVEKLVWVPVISFCKISFPVTHLMPYYSETGRSRPPIRLTFRIILIFSLIFLEVKKLDLFSKRKKGLIVGQQKTIILASIHFFS
jgi:hypothetical protein